VAVVVAAATATAIATEPVSSSDTQVYRTKGVVAEVLRDAVFRVKTEEGHDVMAKASGRMRRGRKIRILPGDTVDVEVSLYDPTKGRIVWRYR
jgi:translation initiation factor IF-1